MKRNWKNHFPGLRDTWTPLLVEQGGRVWTLWCRSGDDSLYMKDHEVGDLLGYEDSDDLGGLLYHCRADLGDEVHMDAGPGSDGFFLLLSEAQALLIAARSSAPGAGALMRQLVEVYRVAHGARVRSATLAEIAERRRAKPGDAPPSLE